MVLLVNQNIFNVKTIKICNSTSKYAENMQKQIFLNLACFLVF